jgi:alanine dehydrogenase
MIVGIPKEIKNNENRVSLIPFGVEDLCKNGHTVIVESNAGKGSGFSNEDYTAAGAQISSNVKSIFKKAEERDY